MKVKPKVKLIAYTPDPEKVVASAAKLCYSDTPASEIMDNLDDEGTERFLNMLMSFGHASPIEHATFTFAIEGVSRALTHQLVRHRLASFSQKSQRYVNEDQFNYILPPKVEENLEATNLFEKTMEQLQDSYDQLVEILTKQNKKELLSQGIDEIEALKKAKKLANEDARFVLPNACETMIVVTMNARELLHFFNVRTCNRAQWEIRDLAKEMLRQAYEVAPTLFKQAGPICLNGPCPEGNMSCGRIKEVRKEFANIKM